MAMRINRIVLLIGIGLLLSGCTKAVSAAFLIHVEDVGAAYRQLCGMFEGNSYQGEKSLAAGLEYRNYHYDYNGVDKGGYFFASIFPDVNLNRVVVIFSEVEIGPESSFSNGGIEELRRIKLNLFKLYGSAFKSYSDREKVKTLHDYYWHGTFQQKELQ